MASNCPDCTHPKSQHTALVGCLHDGPDICDCDRSFKEAKTQAQMVGERDAAKIRAESGTDPTWATEAAKVIYALAAQTEGEGPARFAFTSDDVWERLEELKVPPPREPRALGPILKAAAKADRIRAKGFTESRRRHGAPVRLYEAGHRLHA